VRSASYWPLIVVLGAMGLMAAGHIPVAVAFCAAAVILMLTGAIPPRETYEAIDWPVLVALGALIPVSDSMRTTGATELIADWLSITGGDMTPLGSIALVMTATMLVTPFLNNAATVLVMGPIAAGIAVNLGHRPDPYLMAVAIGAACDFLTPVGHQSNMLVWGPGGYKFTDYWRLGLPLSILVVALGTPLILAAWPLVGR
jgi:di/tricarboxylate transporter